MENKGFVTLTENQMYQVNGGFGSKEFKYACGYFLSAGTSFGSDEITITKNADTVGKYLSGSSSKNSNYDKDLGKKLGEAFKKSLPKPKELPEGFPLP